MSKRRKFSPEFKREAVGMASQPGVTLREVARDVGIGEGMLGRWRREFAEARGQAFLGHGNARDEEVARLKRELARTKKERDFLKDAAAFFAKESK